MFCLRIAFFYEEILSPQVFSARSEDQGPGFWWHYGTIVCTQMWLETTFQAGDMHSFWIYAYKEGENPHLHRDVLDC